MTTEQINKLMTEGIFPYPGGQRELIETHISWVILCDQFVYKIKKPMHYSFLDFSTPALRKYFCEREIELNKRLTEGIYLDVTTIRESGNQLFIGGGQGIAIDYAVRMNRINRKRQMDLLLLENKVTDNDIQRLAQKIASFHNRTIIIYEKDPMDIRNKFNDLETEKEFLQAKLGIESSNIISEAMHVSDAFMISSKSLLAERLAAGYFRDCHGDLHSRNIFLLDEPQPFDCIEFNDDIRQIDVLNEVAFLCMDLDAFDRQDLSASFMQYYNKSFPSIKTKADAQLFVYYKSYRANIRAKINSLRAKTGSDSTNKTKALSTANKYLQLMKGYLNSIATVS